MFRNGWEDSEYLQQNATIKKQTDRQLKEQFINGLNDDSMLAEMIHELLETQTQSLVIRSYYKQCRGPKEANSSSKQFKNKHRISMPYDQKSRTDKIINQTKHIQYCRSSHTPQHVQLTRRYGETVATGIIFKKYAEARQTAVHDIKHGYKTQYTEENKIDMVHIKSINHKFQA